jgi:hypothetical protein
MACVPYASVVGSMMYVMVCTRLDIAHALGLLRRYMSTPEKEHWIFLKRVFRYLCGTKYYVICYQGNPDTDSEVNVDGYVNVDWDRDMD